MDTSLRQAEVSGTNLLQLPGPDASRTTEELAVLSPRPTPALNCRDVVPRQGGDQVVRQILIKQDAHWSGPCLRERRSLWNLVRG